MVHYITIVDNFNRDSLNWILASNTRTESMSSHCPLRCEDDSYLHFLILAILSNESTTPWIQNFHLRNERNLGLAYCNLKIQDQIHSLLYLMLIHTLRYKFFEGLKMML